MIEINKEHLFCVGTNVLYQIEVDLSIVNPKKEKE